MPTTFSIYGLGLEVDTTLSALSGLPSAQSADVVVSISQFVACENLAADAETYDDFYACPMKVASGQPEFIAARSRMSGDVRLTYWDRAVFLVDRMGARVNVILPEGMTAEDVSPSLLGPVMGVVLRMRGVTCLHASTVAVGDHAVAFVGASGAGKSTLAAAFARLGYPVLGDDVLALTDCGDHFLARPAYPRVRLWPDSVAGLFGAADALPRMTPGWEKRFLGLKTSGFHFQEQPLRLAAVYFLSKRVTGPTFSITPSANTAEALMSLISDSYATNFLDTSQRRNEFEILSRFVQQVPLRSVAAVADTMRIDALCKAIVEDVHMIDALKHPGMSMA